MERLGCSLVRVFCISFQVGQAKFFIPSLVCSFLALPSILCRMPSLYLALSEVLGNQRFKDSGSLVRGKCTALFCNSSMYRAKLSNERTRSGSTRLWKAGSGGQDWGLGGRCLLWAMAILQTGRFLPDYSAVRKG